MREAAAQEMRRMIQFRSPARLRYCVNADMLAFHARRQVLIGGGLSPSVAPFGAPTLPPPSIAAGVPTNNFHPPTSISTMPSNNAMPFTGSESSLSTASAANGSSALHEPQQPASANNKRPYGYATPMSESDAKRTAPLVLSSTAQPQSARVFSFAPKNVT